MLNKLSSCDRDALQADNSDNKYDFKLGADKGIFSENLCHSNKAIRTATLRILCHYEPLTCESTAMDEPPEKKLKTENGVSHACVVDNVCTELLIALDILIHFSLSANYHYLYQVVKLLFSIEATPLSISTSRKVILLISRIQMNLAAGRISETYIPLVLNGMVGILHNRFSYLWNPASECISVLISKHVGLVWDKFVYLVEQFQSKFQSYLDQPETNSRSANNLNGMYVTTWGIRTIILMDSEDPLFLLRKMEKSRMLFSLLKERTKTHLLCAVSGYDQVA